MDKKAVDENYVRTLNKTGVATRYLDAIATAAVDFAKGRKLPVLEIGCAFGDLTLALLAQGNSVIANDTAADHVKSVLERVEGHKRDLLVTDVGKFPHDFQFKDSSLSAVVSIWVFHFLSGEEIEQGAKKIFKALEPGGGVFISASSPYVKFLSEFTKVYEKRKLEGARYPGWMERVDEFLSPAQVDNLPASMHFLDPEVLERIFRAAGFHVEYSDFFRREDVTESMALDGRENVGLVARKVI